MAVTLPRVTLPKLAGPGSVMPRLILPKLDALPRLWPTLASGRRLGRYARTAWPWPIAALFYLVLIGLSLIYGFAFGVFSSLDVLPFVGPLAVLALVAIWTSPAMRSVPVGALAGSVTAFVFALLVWPDYIALAIGSLPWITAVRMFGVPMMTILLVSFIRSKRFRGYMYDIAAPTKEISWLFIAFIVNAALTLVLSKQIGYSIGKYVVFMYTGVAPFFAAMFYFSKRERARKFAFCLMIITAISIGTGLYEVVYHQLWWVGHIPSFLQIEDPLISSLLAGSARAASGKYRVQSKFSTSIGLGEFLGLAVPFLLHLFFVTRSKLVRLLLLVMAPAIVLVCLETQSRLAFICIISSPMLYILYRALVVWRARPKSVFAPALVLAYPLFMAMFMVGTFVWRPLSNMVWGGGAEQFSTDSRKEQWAKMWPLLGKDPFGYGMGRSGATLSYYAHGSTMPTVDSFYITTLLDFGVLGYLFFFGMFVIAIVRSGLVALKIKDEDLQFLVAACIALANFVLSKSVYSQTENHPFAMVILGLTVALLRQYKTDTGQLPPLPDESELIRRKDANVAYRPQRAPAR